MSASCPYCRQVMTPPEPDHGQVWRCKDCKIAQELLGYGIAITYIECVINGVQYSVRLDAKDMGTQITRWDETSDGFHIGEVILVAPGLLNITPSNIMDKIKLYLVFS